MTSSRRAAALVLSLAAVALPGCRREPPATPAPAPRPVALAVEAGSPEWLARRATQGLARVAELLGRTPVDLGEVPPSGLREAVRSLGAAEAELAFLLGDGWAPVVYTEAVAFPRTRFVVIGGGAVGGRAIAVTVLRSEAAFLGGVLAGVVSTSRAWGVVGGEAEGGEDRLEAAFAAGFRRVRGTAAPVRAEAADGLEQLAGAGVRVAFVPSPGPASELLEAARAAGVALVVTDPSLVEGRAPGVLAAVSIDLAEAMVRVASDDPAAGRTRYVFDLSSGIVDLAVAESALADAGAAGAEALAAARAEITAGIAEIERLGF